MEDDGNFISQVTFMISQYKLNERHSKAIERLINHGAFDNNNEEKKKEKEIVCDENISIECINSIESNICPLSLLMKNYTENFPVFNSYFIRALADFYRKYYKIVIDDYSDDNENVAVNEDEFFLLLEKTAESSQINRFNLVRAGILNPLYTLAPKSLNLIYLLIYNNEMGMTYFVNDGAVYLLALFSNYPEYQLVISKILCSVSKERLIHFDMGLIPLCNFAENKTFQDLFHNLLATQKNEIMINTIKSIKYLIEKQPHNTQEMIPFLIQEFLPLLTNMDLIPYIIEVCFHFPICDITPQLISICSAIIRQNEEFPSIIALFFLEKNMNFICYHFNEYEFIIHDLFFASENGIYSVKKVVTYTLISFSRFCPLTYYEQFIKLGFFESFANYLNFSLEREFISDLITSFALFLDKTQSLNIISRDTRSLNDLAESIQNLSNDVHDKVANAAHHCLSILNEYRENEL